MNTSQSIYHASTYKKTSEQYILYAYFSTNWYIDQYNSIFETVSFSVNRKSLIKSNGKHCFTANADSPLEYYINGLRCTITDNLILSKICTEYYMSSFTTLMTYFSKKFNFSTEITSYNTRSYRILSTLFSQNTYDNSKTIRSTIFY